MLAHLKRWYKRRWIRSVYPGWRLFRGQERTIAEAAFDEVWFGAWYPWYAVIVLTALCFVGLWLVGTAMVLLISPSPIVVVTLILTLPVAAAVFLACDLLLMYALRPFLQRCVWRGLRRRAIDVCADCGYLLAASPDTTHRCPECGAARPGADQHSDTAA